MSYPIIVLNDGETYSSLDGAEIVMMTEEGLERLESGQNDLKELSAGLDYTYKINLQGFDFNEQKYLNSIYRSFYRENEKED
jgi:hypothetical protein|tara:strand:- start:1285 stop:1530 length:246 start_codon:yes stop_codon:yes gene_type:complete